MASPLERFDVKAAALSVGLHGVLFLFLWFSASHEAPAREFVTYEVELVSPAPPAPADEPEIATEELVVETPEPEPLPPEPERREEVVPVDEPDAPEPDPPFEPATEQTADPAEEEVEAAAPDSPLEEEVEEAGEGISVRLEGLRRDYPEYYDNIIRQIRRCFRWQQGGGWSTTVLFMIRRDGTTPDIEFGSRSGNVAFDFAAMGAVDCAGKGQFGSFSAEMPFEGIEVEFSFRPPGELPSPLGQPAEGVPRGAS